jgi:Zinc carboxypeptidase
MSTIPTPSTFTVSAGRSTTAPVSPKRTAEAAQIDRNHDGLCSDSEIESWMRAQDLILPAPVQSNVGRLVAEYKAHLTGQRPHTANEQGRDYRSLAELEARMHQLVDEHPDRCQLVSLAKTHDGHDVWALKVSSGAQGDTSAKPGVVFTGTHHAREWMTPEVTLGLAEDMIEHYDSDAAMKQRVDSAETWFIPVVNPDGFAYSQTDDNMWRKNRTPITDPANPGGDPLAYGVDLNRNYWDGNPDHLTMYRPDGDTPQSTDDDFGASDDPNSESYRGPAPASEAEVQGLMAFEYGHPNIHGIVDHHSYGGLLMRPWDQKPEAPADVKDYDEVVGRMRAAQGADAYDYIQTYNLYPTTGASVSCHEANGRYGLGVEMGDSFQPPFADYNKTYKTMAGADFAFLDWITEKFPAAAPTLKQGA